MDLTDQSAIDYAEDFHQAAPRLRGRGTQRSGSYIVTEFRLPNRPGPTSYRARSTIEPNPLLQRG